MTYEDYYRQRVKRILDSVVDALWSNPERRFNWAETSFFQRWWTDQDENVKNKFRTLLQEGRIEFIGGGWVQSDEANPTPQQVIEQMTTGHEYLLREFGREGVPRVAWQIDPFGHSSLTPELMSMMGFEALVINRIHYSIKTKFKEQRQMEFLWSWDNSHLDEGMLTHVLHTHYSAPQGFDWEERGTAITEKTVDSRAKAYATEMKNRAGAYRTNNLLVPFGDDFKFQNANLQFSNMDKLIDYINSHPELGVVVQYATVSSYFDALSQSGTLFPVFSGDFFPYADNANSYWTGYYSTRPVLKRLTREVNALIRSGEIAYASARSHFCPDLEHSILKSTQQICDEVNWSSLHENLEDARRQSSLAMHHDAITGTAKKFVVEDYVNRLDRALHKTEQVVGDMNELLMYNEAVPDNHWTFHSSSAPIDVGISVSFVPVQVVNSLGWARKQLVTVYVNDVHNAVYGPDGEPVHCQIIDDGPLLKSGFASFSFPSSNSFSNMVSSARYRLVFEAEVPPLGVVTYAIVAEDASPNTFYLPGRIFGSDPDRPMQELQEFYLENAHLRVDLDSVSGMLRRITDKETDLSTDLIHHIYTYKSASSGAYIMRTNELHVGDDVLPTANHKIILTKGPLVHEVTIDFSSYRVRLQLQRAGDLQEFIHSEYAVEANIDREVVVRYDTDLNTQRAFFTNNGLHTLVRFYNVDDKKPEHRFFPVQGHSFLRDVHSQSQFTVYTKQAAGTSSGQDGQLELMLHRQMSVDDGRGLGEAVRDTSIAEHEQLISFSPKIVHSIERQRSALLFYNPLLLLTSSSSQYYMDLSNWIGKKPSPRTSFTSELPPFIHLLTLHARESSPGESMDLVLRTLDLRSEEERGAKESHALVALHESLPDDFQVHSLREMSLSLLHSASEIPKSQFSAHPGDVFTVSVDNSMKVTDRQNTNEAGVFISMAAIQENSLQNNRKLFSAGRSLQAIDADLSAEQPEINTYLCHLSGYDVDEMISGMKAASPTGLLTNLANLLWERPGDQTGMANQEGVDQMQVQVVRLNKVEELTEINGIRPNGVQDLWTFALLLMVVGGLIALAYAKFLKPKRVGKPSSLSRHSSARMQDLAKIV